MAIAGDKEAYFELSASSVRDLQQRFPEIPADVVSSSLKKNGGNMSRCIKELELASPSFMYGDFVGHNTPTYDEKITPNPPPRTNVSAATYTSQFYTPEQMVGMPIRDPYDHQIGVEDPERTPQPSFTSWASLETGVPDVESRTEPGHFPPSTSEEERHVVSCTLDIQKLPMRTISAPNVETERGSPVPGGSQLRGEAPHRQSSTPYGRTSNGLEQRVDLRNFPFEPRPAWQEHSQPFTAPSDDPTDEPSDRWTPPQPPVKPAESRSGSQIATSYQLDPVQPSSPAAKPRKGKQSQSPIVASYSRTTDSISFNPVFSAQEPARASPKPDDEFAAHQTAATPAGGIVAGVDPIPPKRKERSKRRDATLVPPTLPPDRSTSKEKEDQAYTEALLMHQRARYERLIKELEEEKKSLALMREQNSGMEREVSHKRKNHRSPFPTLEEIGLLRKQKHQLQIDIECMTREIESYKSQGLMDVTQATSFYGNMGSTGAPGPVPPILNNNPIPETVIDAEPPPPPYESLMWSCSACTLLNHPALDKCEACEMPRDNGTMLRP
ncbi:mitogen-activated protein kinase kinase kinase 7-interacting protein 3 homolog [Patiria miniata]|uniref:RanBP2-type domain-containing protein n=1 Tax=Patiria miniata TaxID=46514 RepID=A0A914A6D9_PATMI|nr:mitogen-activated protein kinase kinase kinase 7-interacting protein 3 homolog [Patiria miniata]